MLLFLAIGAMAQIRVSSTEGQPEFKFYMRNGNNVFTTASTGKTENVNSAGLFAFYASGTENAYYIYSVGEAKWVTYTCAEAYSNTQDFVTLSETKEDDDKFYFRAYDGGKYYEIAPYNTSNVAGKYLNWFQGGGKTLGLWQGNATSDTGSKWYLEENVASVSDLCNDRAYILESSRGRLLYNSENAGVVGSSVAYGSIKKENDASLWAIYKSPDTGKYYFYNVAANKFIGQNSDENGRFPLVEKPTNIIEIVSSKKDGYPFVFSTDNYGAINHFNHGTVPGVANWKGNDNQGGLRSLADDGSAHRIYGLRDLTDSEKANIANLVSAFENVEIVYNITYNDEVKITQSTAAKVGEDLPEFNFVLPYGVSATKPTGKVTEEKVQTYKIEVVCSLPFEISTLNEDGAFGSSMHWYTMKLREKSLRCQDYVVETYTNSSDVTIKDLFAFTGNPFDGYKIYNMYAGPSKVLWSEWCNDSGNPIPMTSVEKVIEKTDWVLNRSGEDEDAFTFRRNGSDAGYVNERNSTFSYWINGAGSTDVGCKIKFAAATTNIDELIENYKNKTLQTLDIWNACFDITKAKRTIEKSQATSYELISVINNAVKSIVENKYFTLRNGETDATSTRYNTYLSAKSNTKNEAYGETIKDYDAVWTFEPVGTDFFIYNEYNNVYLSNPGDNGDLTSAPKHIYSFDKAIVNDVAYEGALELHYTNQTLHMNNHNSSGNRNHRFLSSWDNDNASCWVIELFDKTAVINEVLEAEKENHAVEPALGQYSTEAYEALESARTNVRTLEEVEVAIAVFNRAKNRPIFTIDGVINYAEGKSIYDDSDGAPNFKLTNKYDKTMWWVFDQTTTSVGVTESVDVVNYSTGNGFWGAKSLKIGETSDAVEGEDDGIYLFYTVGNNVPLHYQKDNQVIVRWDSDKADSGSATRFTYIGNSFDLDKLTDEKISALSAIQTTYESKDHYADVEIGEGLGKYTGSKDAIVAALTAAEAVNAKTLAEQANLSIEDINNVKTAIETAELPTINMPTTGKYYRIQGACEATLPNYYITGHGNSDGGRIALTNNADASTIYYLTEDKKFVAYQSGLAIALNNNYYTFATIDDNSHPASVITFKESPRTAGAYSIKSADRFLHYKVYEGTVELDRCQNDVHNEHDWYLEEVTTLPVTVTAAGYATFYAPVEVKVPADSNVKAHTVVVDGEKAMLSEEPLETIPANTGVVLMNEGTANLEIVYGGTAEAIEDNNLQGTIAKELKSKENGAYYVLGYLDVTEDEIYNPEVGFYNAAKGEDTTKFYNAGHKAYLFVSGAQASAGLRFDFGGTTAIEEVVVENNENVIYDLQGRRVSEITKAGIYIINGHKVFVK